MLSTWRMLLGAVLATITLLEATQAASWFDAPDPIQAQLNCVSRSNYLEVDYLVVGAGAGGGVTIDDISRAVRQNNMKKDSFAIVEINDYIGGNLKDVPIVQPPGYPSNPKTQPPLIAPMGGARVNQLTMLNERRYLSEIGANVYFTPWQNRVLARGRDVNCKKPLPGQVFSEICTSDPSIQNGAFRNLSNYYQDASFAAYCYLTNSVQYPCDYGEYKIPPHPVTNKQCNKNLDGTPNTSPKADPNLLCPQDACKLYPDWRTFIMDYLSPEYTEFLILDNVGFFGDYEMANSACSYLLWTTREWQTTSVVGYPLGGLSQIPKRGVARAQARGAKLYIKQGVRCIERNGSSMFTAHTDNYTFLVKKFLFLNVPAFYFQNDLGPNNIYGSVGLELARAKRMQYPQGYKVNLVSMQWPPNEPSWHYKFLDKRNGNYTPRAFGDFGCFSRFEMFDTPITRFANILRPVYSDFRCQRLWQRLIQKGQARLGTVTNNTVEAHSELVDTVMQELHSLFPEEIIPRPVWVAGQVWEHAWFFGSAATNDDPDMIDESIFNWATEPLTGENLCLIGESYNTRFSGWVEGTMISSRSCLTKRFPPNTGIGRQLVKIYAKRDKIIANNFDVLTKCPSPLRNEYCGPYGPYNPDGTLVGNTFCAGSKGGPFKASKCKPW